MFNQKTDRKLHPALRQYTNHVNVFALFDAIGQVSVEFKVLACLGTIWNGDSQKMISIAIFIVINRFSSIKPSVKLRVNVG